MFAGLFPILTSATLAVGLSIDARNPASNRNGQLSLSQPNNTLQFGLPNPYPVPDKPFSLNFHDWEFLLLSQSDVVGCLEQATTTLSWHIAQYGDGPIPQYPEALRNLYGSVQFHISRTGIPNLPVLTFNDTLGVLDGFATKLNREGYRQQTADIILTHGGGLLGDAVIWHSNDNPNPQLMGANQSNDSVQLSPLPNPYPLQDSRLRVDFQAQGGALRQDDAVNCIYRAKNELLQYMAQHENPLIPQPPGGPLRFIYRSVKIIIGRYPMPTPHVMTYNDTLNVISLLPAKMHGEGFHRWNAEVEMAQGGAEVGFVFITNV
ncbi:hypothetical protein ACLMJK_008546 [Lecanora helva]